MAGVIHVGAWNGQEYVGAGRRLLLFEPQARPFTELMANLRDQPGVTLVNAAAGADRGRATMYRVAPDHSSSLLQPRTLLHGFSFDGEEDVKVTTVDDEVAHLQLEGCFDELRVDTQGYELEVLKGARRTLRDLRRVECEIHNPDTYPGAATLEQLDAFLAADGFERVGVTDRPGDDPAACYERRTGAADQPDP